MNPFASVFDISVIIPSYNRIQTIKPALHSVIQQSIPACEIIVVDDGSTDQTNQLMQEQFPEIRLIRQKNQGVSAARNRGIREATGNWIAFLDSDDTWLMDKLSLQVEEIKKNPKHPLCHTNEFWVRNGKRVNPMKKHEKKGGFIFQNCLPRCVISPSSTLIKKDLFDQVGVFDETLPACEDYDLWLRICARYPVAYIAQPLVTKYGGHKDQLSKKYWGMDRFRIQALDKLLSSGSLKVDQEKAARPILHKKCRILIKGAEKYQNEAVQDYCEGLMRRFPLGGRIPRYSDSRQRTRA